MNDQSPWNKRTVGVFLFTLIIGFFSVLAVEERFIFKDKKISEFVPGEIITYTFMNILGASMSAFVASALFIKYEERKKSRVMPYPINKDDIDIKFELDNDFESSKSNFATEYTLITEI